MLQQKQKELDETKAELDSVRLELAETLAAKEGNEDSELATLRQENIDRKKKQAQVEKELNEAYNRMSGIVQKKNAPVEELTGKVQKLEASLAKVEAEKSENAERAEKLEQTNAQMQREFEIKASNIWRTGEAERQKLKNEIADLNS